MVMPPNLYAFTPHDSAGQSNLAELLEDFGSVTINGISDVVDCCVKAMEYEGTPMEKGGKAIRL